ncbi:Teichoic acid translocation permease TagG [Fictibacillus phosphorivorans]|uniref:Transport permease protein n=1 Tax=Fictibacillus phosphorivorans TaxID=1221500 RepID=A0A161RRY4_9BACL|nr:ABC transporter permease [Fictibacillus phosphorivorans]KZE64089.1 Teichoic acid translocation permease TagG [Fictibacillus phosphorivorans]
MRFVLQILKEQLSNLYLIFRLASYDMKSKYQMHYLGVFWQFLNPAVQVLVYWVVFGLGIRARNPVDGVPYLIWLLVGLIPWFFISPTIVQGSNSIYSKVNLVSKMKFPVSLLPTITIISNSLNFLVLLAIMVLIMFLNGFVPTVFFFQLPYYLFCTFMFLLAITLLFSTVSVIIRDFQNVLQSFMRMIMFLLPILWDINRLPDNIQKILMLNPLYYLIEGFRNTFLYETWFYEDILYMSYFWFVTLLILLIGSILHLKLRSKFIDYL